MQDWEGPMGGCFPGDVEGMAVQML